MYICIYKLRSVAVECARQRVAILEVGDGEIVLTSLRVSYG